MLSLQWCRSSIRLHRALIFQRSIRSQYLYQNMSKCNWIAVCQMTSTDNKEENLKTCESFISQAAALNAKMVFFPECFDYIVEDGQKKIELAEDINGPTVTYLRSLAMKHNLWLSLGGLHERSSESKRIFVTHVIVNSQGEIAATYRKCHMFSLNMDTEAVVQESQSTIAGSSLEDPVVTPVGLVGLQICYDLRFPEASNAVVQKGAEILTYPSAFTVPTGMAHWEVLLRARAIENQCYVIAAAQVGVHGEKRRSYGHAMVVDPWGSIVTSCGEKVGICMAEIDLNYLHAIRKRMPVFQHRRYDLYNNPCIV